MAAFTGAIAAPAGAIAAPAGSCPGPSRGSRNSTTAPPPGRSRTAT